MVFLFTEDELGHETSEEPKKEEGFPAGKVTNDGRVKKD